jgi:DegV family protein with EDD domain
VERGFAAREPQAARGVRLTAENTAVVLDSTADFPEGAERPSWRIVPLYVRFGDDTLRDYVDLGPHDFYERLRAADELPTTSQPTPQDFLDAYEQLSGYERILSLHIAGKLSGTVQSAQLAAAEAGDRVRVIDTGTVCAAIAMLALAIQRRLEEGTSDEEVDELVERHAQDAGLLFTLETLTFLARGGRIGKARAMAGQLLNVKPILAIVDGEVEPVGRVRGSAKALAELVSRFEAQTGDSPALRVGIAHGDAPERAEALRQLVLRARPRAQVEVVTTLGAVVGTHAGPGTVGFFWFEDPE